MATIRDTDIVGTNHPHFLKKTQKKGNTIDIEAEERETAAERESLQNLLNQIRKTDQEQIKETQDPQAIQQKVNEKRNEALKKKS